MGVSGSSLCETQFHYALVLNPQRVPFALHKPLHCVTLPETPGLTLETLIRI